MPDGLGEEMAAQLMVLSFFANRDIATSFFAETNNRDVTLENMAADMQRLFPDALKGFAHLGKTLQQVIQEHESEFQQPARSEKVGRNQPCTCGSGKKYKKCCGLN